MEKLYATERRALVQRLLTERPICQRCRKQVSQDIHELKSRARGGSITDIENLVAICRECHRWITDNPQSAAQTGWLKHSWD